MDRKNVDKEERIHYGNFDSNKKFLRKVGAYENDGRILEVGCGKGGMLNHLLEKGCKAEGVELNKKHIEESRQIYGDMPIKKVSGEKLPYDQSTFDIVMSFDVIEHIPNTDRHLEEVSRVLKREGTYLLQSPNKWTNSIFETIRHRSFTKWKEDHCSLHSYYQFIERFQKHEFDVKFHKIPVVNDYFKKKVKKNLGRAGVHLLKIANPDKLPIQLRTNFYMEAKK